MKHLIITLIAALALLAPAATATAEWQFEYVESTWGDGSDFYAVVTSNEADEFGRHGWFYIRCMENRSAVLFVPNELGFFVSHGDESARVKYRFDRKKPQTGRWSLFGNENETVGLSGAKAIAFMRELADTKKLAISASGYNHTAQQTFDTTDARRYVKQVADNCNWELQ